jgi:hypothetical protein
MPFCAFPLTYINYFRLAMREEMRKSKELTDWPLRLVVVKATNSLFNENDKMWENLTNRLLHNFDVSILLNK